MQPEPLGPDCCLLLQPGAALFLARRKGSTAALVFRRAKAMSRVGGQSLRF